MAAVSPLVGQTLRNIYLANYSEECPLDDAYLGVIWEHVGGGWEAAVALIRQCVRLKLPQGELPS